MHPFRSRSGEMVSERLTRRPFFASRTVSKWSMRSPFLSRARIPFSSSTSSGGMIFRIDSPIISVGAVAQNSRRTPVPGRNASVEGLADDRVVRPLHDGGQLGGFDIAGFSVCDIDQNVDRADNAAIPVLQECGIGNEGYAAAIGTFRYRLDTRNSRPSRRATAIGYSSWAMGRPSGQ